MPSRALEGVTTDSGWKIGPIVHGGSGSGGNFCSKYTALSPNGKIGFLKAMDLSTVMHGKMEDIKDLIDKYLYEQNILNHCKDNKLSRVVTPLDVGEVLSPSGVPPMNRVFYIIFEFADSDLRDSYLNNDDFLWSDAFSILHNTAVGIKQLHKIGIAHQDIKPSNILCFNDLGAKVSDLGRVTDEGGRSPYNNFIFTGDHNYAPPEIWHRIEPKEFLDRRLSDLYMFGSLIFHLITKSQITPVLFQEVRLITKNYNTLDYEQALPFYKTAFVTILNRFYVDAENIFGDKIAKSLEALISELCFPDIRFRGNLKYNNKISRLSMDRYVGKVAQIRQQLYVQRK